MRVLPAGGWDPEREADCVRLDFDLRHRRRITLHTEAGAHLLLDLPQATHLRDGDGLELRRRHRGPRPRQPRAPAGTHTRADAAELARLAWHLGNRHLPVQVLHGALRIRDDHVIAGMVEALGGTVRRVDAAFDPEPGAYAGGGGRRITTTMMTHNGKVRAPPPPGLGPLRGPSRKGRGSEARLPLPLREGGGGRGRTHPCCACWPGSRPVSRPAPSPARTGWNGRSRWATSPTSASLQAWLEDVLIHGSGRTDAILLRHAHRAAHDPARLEAIAELACAAAPARERRSETTDLGTAFAAAARPWSPPALPPAPPYPVALGALAGATGSTRTPPPRPICRPSRPT